MYTLLPYIFLSFHTFFALLIAFLCISFVTGGPFVPSSKYAATKMVDIANIRPGMTVYDLGSGDGRVLFLAAHRGARAIGIEINPFLVTYTRLRALVSSHRNLIAVQWKNLWNAELRDADIVFVYLLPWKMKTLQTFLKNRLRKGTLVVSNSFIFPNWKIVRKDTSAHIYVYKV